ncbi:AlbA family DNA-binding domain-containing protein [Phytohabitans aurantiacus]|uniref:Schlafen AlbA-2 domain-containing protein n=1 Tax=Phytohabitans aurantiacus TaxID=3016789 RepID=A0ABQ5RBM3_9ACTN|nr:ATP-binding protein [Phytohabitans aurantiacus]GLI03808.1 hypothetical protein Pa4123_90880 [Phytohabitans aurantiacus]
MPTLRSRRLENLFGGPIDRTLTFEQVKGLIPNAGEGPDLDFKRDTYVTSGNGGHKGTKDLCGDIGGMANASGGVIVLGIDEDDQARASGYSPVDTTDEECRRLRQTVYGNLFPMPAFDVVPVEDPKNPGMGFLVIWVARTAGAPHAFAPQGTGLHYPRRIGTEKDWLSEAEVAEAYRARFAGLADRLARVTEVEGELLPRLAPSKIFVLVTLVPDLPGAMTIDTAAFDTFRRGNANRQFGAFGIPMAGFTHSTVRRRRLVATSSQTSNEVSTGSACELHEDGCGVFATTIESPIADNIERQEGLVDNNWLVLGIATALRRLGQHARDTAAAGGLANIRATIWTGEDRPIALVSNVGWRNEQVGHGLVHGATSSDTVADLDDLATDGPGGVAATYRLVNGLFQEFGKPEATLVSREGGIRIRYWHSSAHADIRRWAEGAGVDILTDTLS